MFNVTLAAVTVTALLLLPGRAVAQVKHDPLETADGLVLHNVAAEPATLQGRKGLKLTLAADVRRKLESMTPEARSQARIEQLARFKDVEFSNGVIELEVAGAPAADAPEGARGFVGIAFRLRPDGETPNRETYDAFYLRPTNGRADDQERRNHSAQYISHPDWPWFRLRKETPSRYEAYVDLVPGEWTRIKVDVRGSVARLYVHGNEQPTLIVNDVKTGPSGSGGVALWLDAGTVAHFRHLTVTITPSK
jgi:hypothetical protein